MKMINTNLLAAYVSPLITAFIVFLLHKYFQNRSRIVAYFSDIAAHKLFKDTPKPVEIYTHTIVIKNTGRKAAKNVRLGHETLPEFNTTPHVSYEINSLPDGGKEIVFPVIVPKEQIIISYIYFPPINVTLTNTFIKSDDGIGKFIKVLPSEELRPWIKAILYILLFIGCTFSIFMIIYVIALIF